MKPLTALLIFASVFLGTFALRAEDWTLPDGHVYYGVKVVEAAPDSVVILHRDGGGRIDLSQLPADLQTRFHYDPIQAAICSRERARESAENKVMLQAEMDLAAEMNAVPTSLSSAGPYLHRLMAVGVATKLDLRELAAFLGSSMEPDPNDATHHSMDQLADSMSFLYRDLADPTYHTIANMVYGIRLQGLRPDPSGPPHYPLTSFDGL